MSVYNVNCPQCGRSLNAKPEYAGKTAKCAGCGALFPIPGPPAGFEAPAAPADPSAAVQPAQPTPAWGAAQPGPIYKPAAAGYMPGAPAAGYYGAMPYGYAPPSPQVGGWRTTRNGVNVMRIGIIIALCALIPLLAAVVMMGASITSGFRGSSPDSGAMGALAFLACGGLGVAGGFITMFVGACMCCAVPVESGAKGLAVGCIVLLCGAIVLSIGGTMAFMDPQSLRSMQANPGQGPAGLMAIQFIAQVGATVAHILFFLFLRNVARYFGDERLAGSAAALTVFYVVYSIFSFCLGLVQAFGGLQLIALAAIVAVVGTIVFIVWLLRLLRGVRDLIDAGGNATPAYMVAANPGAWAGQPGYGAPPGYAAGPPQAWPNPQQPQSWQPPQG